MSYNDKKKENIEMDDMKIKSHLDTSLDLNGISVSEDLINRTLEAIKKQTAEQSTGFDNLSGAQTTDKNKTKKIIPWNRYIRGFAGVAAAAVIVVAGYNMLSNVSFGSKSSTNLLVAKDQASTNSEESALENSTMAALDSADATAKMEDGSTDTTEAGTSDIASSNVTDTAIAPQFSISAGTTADSEGAGTSGSTGTAGEASSSYGIAADTSKADNSGTNDAAENPLALDTTSLQMDQAVADKSMESETVLTFRDIFLSEPDKAEYITITNEVNGTVITLTDQAAILDFYTVMDKHQFKYSTDNSANQNYTVKINNPDTDATYLMAIGTYITVNYTDTVTSSQSYYNAVDGELLNQDLKDLIQKYSK